MWIPKLTPNSASFALALLRIAVAVLILLSNEQDIARVVATRPLALHHHPEGLAWLGTAVPITPRSIGVAIRILQASAVLSLLGVWTRVSLSVLAVAFLYVFGAAELTGTVLHHMHLLWFVALLAVAGGPYALSMDAWARSRSVLVDDDAHRSTFTFTLVIARLWLGLVYFFPGMHKLTHGGMTWLSGETLRGQLYFKWYERGYAPSLRIDRAPALLALGSIAVVMIEIAMPFLLMHRRTRRLAAVLAISFHLLSSHFLDVLFPSLIACWVIALPPAPAPEEMPLGLFQKPLLLFVTLVTLGIVIQGVRGQTQSYPIACYPTFADPAARTITDLAVDVDGASFRLPRQRRQDEWGFVWRLAGRYGDPIDRDALESFARTVAPSSGHFQVFREEYDVRPEAHGAPPVERVLLLAR